LSKEYDSYSGVLEKFKHDFQDAGLKHIYNDNDCQKHIVSEIRIPENSVFSDLENNDPDKKCKYHVSKWLS